MMRFWWCFLSAEIWVPRVVGYEPRGSVCVVPLRLGWRRWIAPLFGTFRVMDPSRSPLLNPPLSHPQISGVLKVNADSLESHRLRRC